MSLSHIFQFSLLKCFHDNLECKLIKYTLNMLQLDRPSMVHKHNKYLFFTIKSEVFSHDILW